MAGDLLTSLYRVHLPHPQWLQGLLDLRDIRADALLALFAGLDILAQAFDLIHRGRLGRADGKASTEQQAQEQINDQVR